MIDLRNKHRVVCHRAKGSYLEKAPGCIWTQKGIWCLEPKEDGWRTSYQPGKKTSLLVGRNRQDQAKGVDNAGDFRDLSGANPYMRECGVPSVELSLLDGELTEAYNDDGTLSKSTLKRMSIGDFVGYTTWGAFFYKGTDVRRLHETERYKIAGLIIKEMLKVSDLKHRVRLIERHPADKKILQRFFDAGLEGGVAKRLDVGLPGDQKTNPFWWKLKSHKNRTVDAIIIGVTEGKSGGSGVRGVKAVLDGTVASFTIGMLKEGRVVEVGKMKYLPEQVEREGLSRFDKYKGRVVEVRVAGWNGEEFRAPRFVRFRGDKRDEDCQYYEQIGKKSSDSE